MNHDSAIIALKSINDRVWANVCPKVITDADVAAYTVWQEKRIAINAEAKALGFIRIFDGSFKLDLSKIEAE